MCDKYDKLKALHSQVVKEMDDWKMKCVELGAELDDTKEELKEAEDMTEQYSQDADRATNAEAENEELKEDLEKFTEKAHTADWMRKKDNDTLKKQNVKLTEENEELQNQVDQWEIFNEEIREEHATLISAITGNYKKHDEVKKILKKNLSAGYYESIETDGNRDSDPLGIFDE
jgi:predicted  nucleic acid-binding Zn-ribbon protein